MQHFSSLLYKQNRDREDAARRLGSVHTTVENTLIQQIHWLIRTHHWKEQQKGLLNEMQQTSIEHVVL